MYDETIAALKEMNTIANHITSLGRVMNITNDKDLHARLDKVIKLLQRMHVNPRFKYRSTPVNLIGSQNPTVKDLSKYCIERASAKKPEWQVVAERHGWGPAK
uniref:hypothetical protein n=1 Tax=Thaumasiovibrio occultus TaxID=1891184 RepID=UPI000B350669|nr:hypothetical protein [Thaumasiovibrio occultus]